MKNALLIPLMVFILLSCNQKKQQQAPAPETPKALQESGSAEFSLLSKRGYREDLVENLYAELVSTNPDLKAIEKQISYLDEARTDSIEPFNNFNQKNEEYYNDAHQRLLLLSDSALKNKISLLISNSQSKYNTQIAGHNNLLSLLNSKNIKLRDMHVILKIVKTLPLIEKYQHDNITDKKPIEKTINDFDKTLKKIDSVSGF
jgi:hypothetical protein